MAELTPGPVKRVVVMVQENHTVDSYFRGLAPYGGNVATGWPLATNPPASDPPHDRRAYYDWLTGASTGAHVQFDTVNVLPYYLYLAVTGAFLENHCAGFGTNSTANHLIIVGGQSPTLKNPSFSRPPHWDMPSLPGLAEDHGISWRAYGGSANYPLAFYTQLQGSPNVVPSSRFLSDAMAGSLPSLVMLWHNSPLDEHPPADVTQGMDIVWQSVDAVVQAGSWDETVFILTWDDWGGYDDHVKTPVTEYTPDNVQLAYGPRIPLLIFGGQVKPGIDSRWCGHASIPKTAIDLLGLPALGVPRVDQAPTLADLVDPNQAPTPSPPAYGSAVQLPAPPSPPIAPRPTPPPPASPPSPAGDIILRGGGTLPPPNDAPLPPQPHPPANSVVPGSRSGGHPGQASIPVHHPLRPPRRRTPPDQAGATPAWPSYTGNAQLVGTSSTGVTVYVDPSLGEPAVQNARDLLAAADHVVQENNAIFGITGGAVDVIVFALGGRTDGTGGADHDGCDFTTGRAIEVDASYGSSPRVVALFEAELSECAMGGRLCGVSTGEALSRWCATVVGANALADFATAPQWAQNGMPNWVDQTAQTDQDANSTGCGMAFLSWLMSQGHSLGQIAQAMVILGDAGTLAQLYGKLTSQDPSHAWSTFVAAVKALPGGVTSDDPFNALASAGKSG